MLKLDLPYPISVNRYHRAFNRGKFVTVIKSKEGRDFDLACDKSFKNQKSKIDAFKKYDDPLKILIIRIVVYGDPSLWFTQKNTIKKVDCDNFIKPTLDNIARALNIDDSRFFHVTIKKEISTDKGMRVKICQLRLSER